MFFSAEAMSPASKYLMDAIYPVEQRFNEVYESKYKNDELESIAIIFICTNQSMQESGFYPERNYISHKNKYADMRMIIPYNDFLKADEKLKKQMIWDVIKRALDNIRRKRAYKRIDELEDDIYSVFWLG